MSNLQNLREYSSFDLLEMAIKAVKLDLTDDPNAFREHFKVHFTFLQLCSILTKRKIWNKQVLSDEDYEIITSSPDKETLSNILDKARERNNITLAKFHY